MFLWLRRNTSSVETNGTFAGLPHTSKAHTSRMAYSDGIDGSNQVSVLSAVQLLSIKHTPAVGT